MKVKRLLSRCRLREKLEDKIIKKEKELNQLKSNINQFRRGNVVIKRGQTLFIAQVSFDKNVNLKSELAKIYNSADKYVKKIVNLVKKSH